MRDMQSDDVVSCTSFARPDSLMDPVKEHYGMLNPSTNLASLLSLSMDGLAIIINVIFLCLKGDMHHLDHTR